ncbi:MAG: 4-(cytidine 5'-diphospho)-2-C-methyl-D-erythritol kinase [Lachnospiraceae bacterium]|nr:4-(cytidine 5'-diphospho)-2-C-methyl-D-erythritol kinase [Lachnospiraceae bacterium]
MQTLHRKAYAKINLALDVIGRLENGYHQVRMIMQTVDIYDELTFQKAEDGIHLFIDAGRSRGDETDEAAADVQRIADGKVPTDADAQRIGDGKVSMGADVQRMADGKVPADQSNLIYKAAKLLLDTAGVTEGVSIHLQKNIPVAAGMAGGSTDAAATLLGLNELFQLHYTIQELQDLGVKVGADVPYCIQGGTALAEGIGEILSPLPSPPQAALVVAKPDIDVSTAFVYRNLHLEQVLSHPDIDGMIRALESQEIRGIAGRLENVLETVTVPAYPVIRQIKELMAERGALGALMSGSGPTVFGIFEQEEAAAAAARAILSEGLSREVFVTEFAP